MPIKVFDLRYLPISGVMHAVFLSCTLTRTSRLSSAQAPTGDLLNRGRKRCISSRTAGPREFSERAQRTVVRGAHQSLPILDKS